MKTTIKSMQHQLNKLEIQTIEDILTDQLHVERDQIRPEAALMEDLGADSLDVVEISIRIEETFSLSIPDEEMEKIRTVEDLWDAASRLIHGSPKKEEQ